ncbi:hypothetical protein ARMGADRAFT_819268 [Armillaria gallica]|uniref:Uncharacterized protein n=1 Tax=Armillaria gallica TaxID=47427 RepID=A0A2H3CZV1_ARMGA|nr:hypothetical protein ARMGADRAFT_819268 [Armillaria gallica]
MCLQPTFRVYILPRPPYGLHRRPMHCNLLWTYWWQASPLLAYFISSATGASVALTTGGPSDIRGHLVIQGVGVVLEGISKKATDPSMYPFPFDCLF